jgi:hypothetical protein
VRVEDYCTAIRVKMLALDKQIYPNDQFWDLFALYLTIIDLITF